MPISAIQSNSVRERTIAAIRQILERALSHLNGFEKMAVSHAIQMLYPRIERRIFESSEEELQAELRHLQGILESVLQDTTVKKEAVKNPRKTKRKTRNL